MQLSCTIVASLAGDSRGTSRRTAAIWTRSSVRFHFISKLTKSFDLVRPLRTREKISQDLLNFKSAPTRNSRLHQ